MGHREKETVAGCCNQYFDRSMFQVEYKGGSYTLAGGTGKGFTEETMFEGSLGAWVEAQGNKTDKGERERTCKDMDVTSKLAWGEPGVVQGDRDT